MSFENNINVFGREQLIFKIIPKINNVSTKIIFELADFIIG